MLSDIRTIQKDVEIKMEREITSVVCGQRSLQDFSVLFCIKSKSMHVGCVGVQCM